MKIIGLFVFAIFLFTGCAKEKSKKDESTVLKAYRLIDSQRTDEAIELLETSLSQDPDNYEYHTVLASAYAHKAGIKIQKLVPILAQSERMKALNKKTIKVPQNEQLSTQVNQSALRTAKMLSKFALLFETYASVPAIDKKNEPYLKHAIQILNNLGTTIKPADVLYRVILEIVLFKHILAENLIGEFTTPQVKDEVSCHLNLGVVNDSIITLGKLLIDIYTDLGFAQPKQAKDMQQLAQETAESISDVTILTTTLSLVDDVSHIFLKHTIIESGFGKMMRCGGK